MKWLTLLCFFILSACTSLSKDDCTSMNWFNQGKKDASTGAARTEFNEYNEQCRKHGLAASEELYSQGYQSGLKSFCNFQSGLNYGRKGSKPFEGCRTIDTGFYTGYQSGMREYEEEEKKAAVKKILTRFDSKECLSDFDCRKDGDCRFNECAHNKLACTFNTDCKVEGSCRSETEHVSSINSWVHVNVCHY